MESNPSSFIGISAGYPVVALELGWYLKNDYTLTLSGTTDGGHIWRDKNTVTDFGIISLQKSFSSFRAPRLSYQVGLGAAYPTAFVLVGKVNLNQLGLMSQGIIAYSIVPGHTLTFRLLAFSPNLLDAPPAVLLGYRIGLASSRSRNGVI